MSIGHDVVYAARLLRRTPVFTVTAVLSLGIGIGANAAIFSLADALLLRERPGIRHPGELVDVGRSQRGEGFDNMSYPNYLDLRDRNTVFTALAAFRFGTKPMGLGLTGGAETVYGAPVSGNYFDVVGAPFALGRGFLASEDQPPGGAHVAVLSYRLWHRRFERSRGVLGRTIHINGHPFTIVGVAGERFEGNTVTGTDVWIPITTYPVVAARESGLLTNRAATWMVAIGRLQPGVTLEQARAEMATLGRALEQEFPDANRDRGIAVVRSHRLPGFMRGYVSAFVGLLFALVGLVLAIACTNVAGMMLARSLARAREVAVRMAIGAGKARIVGQLLTESLLLAAAGAALGVLLAVWLVQGLNALIPALPVLLALGIRLDWRVVVFSATLALATGALFGLAPALHAARADLAAAMKADGRATGPRRLGLRQSFVVAQVALSVLLVVTGVLLTRSLVNAGTIDPGFDAANVDAAELDTRLGRYDEDSGARIQEQVLARARQLPGVRSAAYVANVPLIGSGLGLGRLTLPGQPATGPDPIRPDWNVVTPEYFETMRTPILRGRRFSDADQKTTPAVAIVNETFARRAWPGGDAVGQTLEHHAESTRVLHVIGVARDGKYRSLGEEPRAYVYVPLAQNPWANTTLLVKTDGRRVAAEVRAIVRQIDPNLPLVHAATLEETTAVGLLPHRLAAGIAGAFGLLGVLLAAIGVYGITAYNVAQRTREIGVRMALGAAQASVLRLVIGQAMRISGLGAALGLLLAAVATRLLASLLYGVTPLDPLSFAAGAALFGALSLAATLAPARRAAAVNPVEALRAE